MNLRCTTALIALTTTLQALPAAANPPPSLLEIPDSDDGLPGAGPLRRTDWFRGVWRERRGSWSDKTEAQKGSVVFLGDSITQGWGDDFNGAFGQLKVANRGISGDTSRGLLVRLKEDVIDIEPRAVVLMIGANDLAEKAPGETVFGNVKLIVEALKTHHPEMPIVLCETFPCAPDHYRPVAEIRKINALYATTYADDPQVTLAKTYALFAGGDGASLPGLFPDRVHPNGAGYAKWAGVLRPIFADLGFAEDTTPDPQVRVPLRRHDGPGAKGRFGGRARSVFRLTSFSLAVLGQTNAARDARPGGKLTRAGPAANLSRPAKQLGRNESVAH